MCRVSLMLHDARLPAAGRLLLGSVGSGALSLQELWLIGSAVEAHGISCSTASWIFAAQGSNRCLLHWQMGS